MSEEVARERGLFRAQTLLICGTLKSKLHRGVFRMLLLRFLLLVLYRCGSSPVTLRKERKLRPYKNNLHEFILLVLRLYPTLPSKHCFMLTAVKMLRDGKGKAEGSRKLRFPDFMTTAQDSGKVVSLTHRRMVLISVRC